jgi:peroxiredoxin
MSDVGEQLSDIELRTHDGEPVLLSRYLERPTVVQLLRYYG